jgi:hypothetical protein
LLTRVRRGIGSWPQVLGPVLMLLGLLCTGATSHAQTSGTPSIGGTPPPSVIAGQAYTFTPTVTVPEGQSYSLSISGMPAWASFDVVTGRLHGTPTAADVGTYAGIRILLKSGQYFVSLPQFSIEVLPNRPPVIGGTPSASATVGTAYSFRPTASDPDGQTLKFSIANKPAWASFATTTGRLYGTPGSTRVGTYSNIVISVSDGLASVSLPPFSITVSPNSPPTIAGVPSGSAMVGKSYSFLPTASDPNGQTLKFSIANKPAWASFATSTGRLYGTPDSTRVGTYSNIVISVSDGQVSASLPPFAITVAPNRPPVISGVPPGSAPVGKTYSFLPTASDPEGATPKFSIVNKPAWATFVSTTGRLYGTPGSTRIGTYPGIRISVSDGHSTVSLPEFSITVAAVTSGTATVSWTPPSTYEDGTPLVSLAGFRILYGSSPSDLSKSVDIPNPTITSARIEALAPGTWYFAVKAYTTASIESDLSTVGYKTIY